MLSLWQYYPMKCTSDSIMFRITKQMKWLAKGNGRHNRIPMSFIDDKLLKWIRTNIHHVQQQNTSYHALRYWRSRVHRMIIPRAKRRYSYLSLFLRFFFFLLNWMRQHLFYINEAKFCLLIIFYHFFDRKQKLAYTHIYSVYHRQFRTNIFSFRRIDSFWIRTVVDYRFL